jgi:hypothetical protein
MNSKILPLVRFGCGCIGLPATEEGKSLVFKSCRSDYNGNEQELLYEEGILPQFLKNPEKLNDDEIELIVKEINRKISDGSKFRELKNLILN